MTETKMTETKMIETNCIHHWMLPIPDGKFSLGTCKICGTTKEFSNSTQEYTNRFPLRKIKTGQFKSRKK